jgi:hypothetical protein
MRGNSQLLPSRNSFVDKTGSMKTPVMLLLTNDNELEELGPMCYRTSAA